MAEDTRLKLKIVACGTILLLFALTADALTGHEELDRAWRDYRQNADTALPAMNFPHARCFRATAAKYQLPESLLLAVARGESDFEVTARSRANAHGIMQILWPDTARHLGFKRLTDLYDPCRNIDAGGRYLVELLQRYDDNLHLALAAYNYGPGRIPGDGRALPTGAIWYSGYIYRHLNFVLGRAGTGPPPPDTLYSDIGQSTLVTFGEPYRAAAFVARLEATASGLKLDWFRRGTGEFEVVMTYANRDEFDASARHLVNAGYRLD